MIFSCRGIIGIVFSKLKLSFLFTFALLPEDVILTQKTFLQDRSPNLKDISPIVRLTNPLVLEVAFYSGSSNNLSLFSLIN